MYHATPKEALVECKMAFRHYQNLITMISTDHHIHHNDYKVLTHCAE